MSSELAVIYLNPSVKQHTVAIRRKTKLKLPDAIIAATAMSLGVPMLTADADFKKIKSLELLLLE
ncbi:MAG: PIN domain-containing protein [Cryomorphaceae bacterium]|nr:PIN domain-containing protein [Flavobacteriales bacterium]